jgi:DNA-binding NarL/FixJ family response regulator
MMEAGVAGYLDKRLNAGRLISCIRRAVRGETLFDQEQVERARRWKEEVSRKWENLSSREREVLEMLSEGVENKIIAAALSITINTVEKHLEKIYKKLEVTSRAAAICWWVEKNT